jgi:Zn-dependent alcohol dehydrogenase
MGQQLALGDINAGFDRLAGGNALRDVLIFD